MHIESKTVLSDALMLHHSISALQAREQIAFAIDCVHNIPTNRLFCSTDRLFLNEMKATILSTLEGEDYADDTLAVMIPLMSEMCAELYNATRSDIVDAKEYNRNMAASHMADAYLALAELVYCRTTHQGSIASAHDVAKSVRQAAYWMVGSLEREKFEMIYQQKRAQKHLYGMPKVKKTVKKNKVSAEILPFPKQRT